MVQRSCFSKPWCLLSLTGRVLTPASRHGWWLTRRCGIGAVVKSFWAVTFFWKLMILILNNYFYIIIIIISFIFLCISFETLCCDAVSLMQAAMSRWRSSTSMPQSVTPILGWWCLAWVGSSNIRLLGSRPMRNRTVALWIWDWHFSLQ